MAKSAKSTKPAQGVLKPPKATGPPCLILGYTRASRNRAGVGLRACTDVQSLCYGLV